MNEFIINNVIHNEQHNIKDYQNLINYFLNQIEIGSMNSILNNINENKIDYILKSDNIIIQITTLENQNNNENNNIS